MRVWRIEYNQDRPRGSVCQKTLMELGCILGPAFRL